MEAPKVETPEYTGGATLLDPPIMEKPEYKEITVTPISNARPNPEPEKTDIKDEKQKPKDSTSPSKENAFPDLEPVSKKVELPSTGIGQEFAIFSVAASSILMGLGLLVPTFKKKEE